MAELRVYLILGTFLRSLVPNVVQPVLNSVAVAFVSRRKEIKEHDYYIIYLLRNIVFVKLCDFGEDRDAIHEQIYAEKHEFVNNVISLPCDYIWSLFCVHCWKSFSLNISNEKQLLSFTSRAQNKMTSKCCRQTAVLLNSNPMQSLHGCYI